MITGIGTLVKTVVLGLAAEVITIQMRAQLTIWLFHLGESLLTQSLVFGWLVGADVFLIVIATILPLPLRASRCPGGLPMVSTHHHLATRKATG